MFEMLTAVRTLAVQTGEVVAEAGDTAAENAESVKEAVDLAADAATVGGGAAFAIFVIGFGTWDLLRHLGLSTRHLT